jgi:RNA polymerase sigma-70 factor (ECF subfamily)
VFLRNNGDKAAFTEIYNRYHKDAYRYLLSLIKVSHIAEDLVHEVFLKLWETREKIEIRENFAGYLFRICHNKAVDSIRKVASERALREQLVHHYQVFSLDEYRSAENLKRFDNLVEEALNSLPPKRRKVFELCRREGRSYQEVADQLQISPNTVKEHMAKALSSLRIFLHDKGQLTIALLLFENIFKNR